MHVIEEETVPLPFPVDWKTQRQQRPFKLVLRSIILCDAASCEGDGDGGRDGEKQDLGRLGAPDPILRQQLPLV